MISKRLIIGIVCGAAGCFVGTSAFATPPEASAAAKAVPVQTPTEAKAKASFKVTLIEASKVDKPVVDKRLDKMRGQLRPFNGKYNQFKLISTQVLTLNKGQRGVVKVPSKGDFAITFLEIGSGKVKRVRYQVELPRPRTRMTRRVAPGGQTLDVIPHSGKLTIVSTTVMR